jgi:uncharacterized protein (DUF433 family)
MRPLNRKMFRKKGGGATGIMASGPELMKRFNGGGVNVPGGGSTLARSGFPGVTAFGSSIPPIVQPPSAVKVPDQLGFYKIPGLGVSTPIPKSPIATLIGPNRTRFGKSALEQLAETESQIGRQGGPFSLKSGLVASIDDPQEKFKEKDPKPTREEAYASGFRDLGPGINQPIINVNEMTGVDQFDELQTDYDKVEEEKIKEKKTKITDKTINTPSSADNLIKKLDISPTSDNKGDGIEVKGKTKGNVNTTENKTKYNDYTALLKNYLEKNDGENAANATLKAHGFKDNDIKDLSPKEKVDEVKSIITEVMGGEDPSKDMGLENDLNAMNIVMLGLSIAAGDSPDALTNIAKGAKEHVLRRSKQIKEKRDEERQLDLLALKTVLGREDKKEDRKFQKEMAADSRAHDLTLFSKKSVFEMSKLAKTHNFQKHINTINNNLKLKLDDNQTSRHSQSLKAQIITLTETLKNKTEIANAQLKQAGEIAEMNDETRIAIAQNQIESQELRTIIGNLPEGYGFAMIEGKKKGLEGDALVDYAKEKGKVFAKNPYLTGPDSFRRMIINVVPKIMKEDGVTFEKALETLGSSIKGNDEILQYFPELQLDKINSIIDSTKSTTDTSGFKVIKEN